MEKRHAHGRPRCKATGKNFQRVTVLGLVQYACGLNLTYNESVEERERACVHSLFPCLAFRGYLRG
jgi:hypothetical protein